MKKIVLDTKIIFSALVNKSSKIADFLLDPKGNLVMPNSALIELFKQKEKICAVSKHTEEEVLDTLYELVQNIEFYNEKTISSLVLQKAWGLVSDRDPKDMLFVASALEVRGLLWSEDNSLRTALTNKGFNSFFTLS